MTKNRLVLDGLVGFRRELGHVPAGLVAEAQTIVQQEGEAAIGAMRVEYPSKTGNLRRGLRLLPGPARPFVASVRLLNRAPHAWIFEVGTKVRQGAGGNQLGKGSRAGNRLASRGAMPAGHVFIPNRERATRRVDERIRQLLAAFGFQVRGDAR